jgi:predicted Zn-dependent peptidase
MESDRLINPVFREFYAERDVVYEERRMRTESTPTGIHDEAVNSMFWQASPYHWPVIGWPSDVSELSLAQAQDYYRTWYGPGNVTAILAGDFETRQVIELAERYFGRMESRPDPPALVTLEPAQSGEKRYLGEADTNPSVTFSYHCGGFKHADSGALQVLASLLNGDTGRLRRRLVQEGKTAVRAYAYYDQRKYEGAFLVEAEAAENVGCEVLETAMEAELRRLAEEPVPERELQKVKNSWFVDSYRDRQSPIRAAFGLIGNEGMGDWREQENMAARIQAVTPAELRRVAAGLLKASNRMVTQYVRGEKKESPPEPAGLAELPGELQAMARQLVAQINKMSDGAALEGMRARITAQPAGDEGQRAMGRVLLEAVDARLAALQAEGGSK